MLYGVYLQYLHNQPYRNVQKKKTQIKRNPKEQNSYKPCRTIKNYKNRNNLHSEIFAKLVLLFFFRTKRDTLQ